VILYFSGTSVGPDGDQQKAKSRSELMAVCRDLDQRGMPRLLRAGRYAVGSVVSGIWWELRSADSPKRLRVSVDISCFTRIQLIFLLKALMESGQVERLRLLYTQPVKYGRGGGAHSSLGRAAFTPIPLPLIAKKRRVLSQVKRIAFVALGHEGLRTF